MHFVNRSFAYSCILFIGILFVAIPNAFSQCDNNTLEYNGVDKIFNTACGNNSYQTITAPTGPTGSGQTYKWEASFSGGAYFTLPVTSSSLSKSDQTNHVLTPNSHAAGDYRIRRIITDLAPNCTNISPPVFLYYADNVSLTSGGTIKGTQTVCAGTSGTITLSGHTGPVLKWESAPTSAGPWTPIVGANYYEFSYSNLTTSI